MAVLTLPLFLWPGLFLARDLCDPALRGPGIPTRAREIHAALTPQIAVWARERVATGRAESTALHDVPTTEWPLFTAVFYLMATESLVVDWEARGRPGRSPAVESAEAVAASKALLLDPAHHSWVRRHWGANYLHNNNVFFRSLLIAGLSSHERITHDGTALPMLRDQVETLSAALDASPLGVLEDYPSETYPIDVLAAVGFIRRADAVLGTDHSAFVARSRRAFTGAMADDLGLVPFRMSLPGGEHVQPSRGIGNSWVMQFVPDLYGRDVAGDLYGRYERGFYQRHRWAEGFREHAYGRSAEEYGFEVDAGPVIDGFGTAASAFGIAAARRNGRFDHAWALSTELSAASWTLPGGTLFFPRLASHAADAPFLGEAASLYFLTVQPAPGVPIVTGGGLPGLARIGLIVYFGVPLAAWLSWLVSRRRRASSAHEKHGAHEPPEGGHDDSGPRGGGREPRGAQAVAPDHHHAHVAQQQRFLKQPERRPVHRRA